MAKNSGQWISTALAIHSVAGQWLVVSKGDNLCRSDLQVAILYAISMNVPAEQDAPPTMWVGDGA